MAQRAILTNKIKCERCNDVIESTHVHDYVTCDCGLVSADGGKDYLKRGFQDPNDYEELSEYRDDNGKAKKYVFTRPRRTVVKNKLLRFIPSMIKIGQHIFAFDGSSIFDLHIVNFSIFRIHLLRYCGYGKVFGVQITILGIFINIWFKRGI